jgi:hypothetical protein
MTVMHIMVGGPTVEIDGYEYLVHLTLIEGDERMNVTLGPDDARAVAAALVHQASEVEP